jgi:hypothetical protein
MDFGFLRKIRILSAKAHHFKGFADEIELDFTKITQFISDNSKGKSSIGDLITFPFTGTTAFGEKIGFFNEGKLFTWVQINFEDADGNVRELKREIQKDKAGKTSTTIRLDHSVISSTEWNKAIDTDLFLSIVNPKYFSTLTPSKAKNLLCSLISIDRSMVESLLDEKTADAIIGTDFSIFTVDQKRSEVLKEIKEYEGSVKELQVKLHSPFDLKIPEELTFDEKDFIDTVKDLDFANPVAQSKLIDMIKERDEIVKNNAIRQSLLEQKASYDEEIELIKDELAETETNTSALKTTYAGLDDFKLKYLGLVVNDVNSKLANVSVQLFEKSTDGKDKESFAVLFKGKNLNTCSNTEQVRTGIEIHQLLSNLTGLYYPLITLFPNGSSLQP